MDHLHRTLLSILAVSILAGAVPPVASASNVIQGGSFEEATDIGPGFGLGSPFWSAEDSVFDSPICNPGECGAPAIPPPDGTSWVWFGGSGAGGPHSQAVRQQFQLPSAATGALSFGVVAEAWNQPAGGLSVRIDGTTRVFRLDDTNVAQFRPDPNNPAYRAASVSVGQLAVGTHTLAFVYETDGPGFNSVFVDSVALDVVPSSTATPSVPSNQFTVGNLKRNLNHGTAKLAITVPGAGQLALTGKGVKPFTTTAVQSGTVPVTVRARGRAKERLRRRGHATVRGTVAFTPSGGTTAAQPLAVKLIVNRLVVQAADQR